MTIREEKVKAFKRLLKELGVYNSWVTNRKKYLKEHNCTTNIFKPIYEAKSAGHVISSGFLWQEKYDGDFWCDLYQVLAVSRFKLQLSEFDAKQRSMERMKKIVEKYFKYKTQ